MIRVEQPKRTKEERRRKNKLKRIIKRVLIGALSLAVIIIAYKLIA